MTLSFNHSSNFCYIASPESHTPDVDLNPAICCPVAVEHLVLPTLAFAAVKDHQMTRLCITAVHVASGLLQAIGNSPIQALIENFALNHDFARALTLRPDDEQISASTPQTILPLNASTAVHNALQKRLQQQLRTGLLILEPRHPVL